MTTALLLAACGTGVGSGGEPTPSALPNGTRTATSSASTSTVAPTTPAPTASSSVTVDVAAARRAALALYARYPENTTDPSAGWVWSRAPVRQSPLSAAVVARLDALTRADWWSDQKCGEDYIDGNQVGLDQAPVVVSSRVDPDGSVTVVVRGSLDGRHRDLTVTVTDVDGRWTVTDLARGSGPNASIFSPAPNC